MRRPQNFTLMVLVGVVIDHLSKYLVTTHLAKGQVLTLIPQWLEITPEQNFGVAFSLFRNHTIFIVGVSVLALTLIAVLYLRLWRTAHSLMICALGLLLIGAIGNLIDRLVFGYVRDFINFIPPLPFIGHWAVFNVADICITVGVVLFLIAEVFFKDKPTPLSTPQQQQAKATP